VTGRRDNGEQGAEEREKKRERRQEGEMEDGREMKKS
jgi:hypothetical protein